ncbi:MAG: T9SS type A sorting domain-containing protein [Ignavibacteria bacterium]|jgi:photosystem II stability/assembly factor-like uncharacterized protein|nr:T9SS type A sorting domain-containing protein [Ignavibacteria bacterium]
MKKSVFLFTILFLFTASNCFTQAWVSQNSGTTRTLNSVYFCNTNTGFAAGDSGTIRKTTNGGVNWSPVNSPFGINFGYVIMFGSDSVIIASKVTDSILYSTNSGANWILREATPNSYSTQACMCFVSFNNGVFYRSGIYITSNAGINWAYIYTSLGARSVSFVNSQTGWICGTYTLPYPPPYGTNYSEIRKTTNAGVNWVTQFSAQEQSFSMRWAYMINANTGIANGNPTSWSLYRTVNGGVSWSSGVTGAGMFQNYEKMSFPDYTTGYLTGYYQTIKTTSGGANWFIITTPHAANTYKDVHFADANTGWLVGTGGIILKTTTGGITGISSGNENVTSYKLSQNYPNPFNPTTKIGFALPKQGLVTIKVFDVLGKEIETLVNESLKPGTYETTFDGSNYPSGVYFCRMGRDGKTAEVIRMVLLK